MRLAIFNRLLNFSVGFCYLRSSFCFSIFRFVNHKFNANCECVCVVAAVSVSECYYFFLVRLFICAGSLTRIFFVLLELTRVFYLARAYKITTEKLLLHAKQNYNAETTTTTTMKAMMMNRNEKIKSK